MECSYWNWGGDRKWKKAQGGVRLKGGNLQEK